MRGLSGNPRAYNRDVYTGTPEKAPASILSSGPRDPLQIHQPGEHVARLRSIRRTKDASQMQLVDYPRRAAIAYLEPPLKQRRGAMLVLDHDLRRFAEQLV